MSGAEDNILIGTGIVMNALYHSDRRVKLSKPMREAIAKLKKNNEADKLSHLFMEFSGVVSDEYGRIGVAYIPLELEPEATGYAGNLNNFVTCAFHRVKSAVQERGSIYVVTEFNPRQPEI